MKRIIIATLMGMVGGFICLGMASMDESTNLPWQVGAQIFASRTLIGFAIGISSLSLGHWTVHGASMGFLFSLPLAFSTLMAPENPEFSSTMIFVSTLIMGMIYGLLTETVTSLLFKARQVG